MGQNNLIKSNQMKMESTSNSLIKYLLNAVIKYKMSKRLYADNVMITFRNYWILGHFRQSKCMSLLNEHFKVLSIEMALR